MTGKLYYQDAYLTSFETKIVKEGFDESQKKAYVLLEDTAFYPTGGGQPHDIGEIDGHNVLDVEEVNGELRHYVETIPKRTDKVSCSINWERRFDHMQQHAGQHILSAAFENTYGYKTISFHLGKEICTIDLAITDINEVEINQVELICNKIILENKPIITKWITEEELPAYHLRKELTVKDNIRLVIIPGVDDNGCGGTHPKSTGEVSVIKILGLEKQKKHIRVQFVCGHRVRHQLHDKHKVMVELTSKLNAPQEKLSEAADRLIENNRELQKDLENLKSQLIQYEANELISNAHLLNNVHVISSVYINRPISDLQDLAKDLLTKKNNTIIILISDNQEKLQLVSARSEDINLNLNAVLKGILPDINGKGGGKPSFVQAGGDKAISSESLLRNFLENVKNVIN
ncbi:alanyl-tRNA editing protein [Metabacillus litoralis]|uniref:alanyl-tRNA editing protein n=1 Tax=Metabacillus litoralis TaxID=152268 RepID=UPI001CFC64CA|nr:DHHA1 domain-containing protein [Metabacillus litoralis]